MSSSGAEFPPIKRFESSDHPIEGGYGTQEGIYNFFQSMVILSTDQLKARVKANEESFIRSIYDNLPILLNNCPDIQSDVDKLIQYFQNKHPDVFRRSIQPVIERIQLENSDELPSLEPPPPPPPSSKKAAFFQPSESGRSSGSSSARSIPDDAINKDSADRKSESPKRDR